MKQTIPILFSKESERLVICEIKVFPVSDPYADVVDRSVRGIAGRGRRVSGHCSDPTTLDAVEASERPVMVTHAFCRSVSDHDRGKSDDVIRTVGESGGYFGVVTVPFFITK